MNLTKVSKKETQDNQRKYIAQLAIDGAKIKNCGKMCSSCAFKLNSEANLESHNVEAAAQSLMYGQFNCHIETNIDSGKPCAGFMNALQIVDPERKLRYYIPKHVFECPYCLNKYSDLNDKFLNRINANKSGFTKIKCGCGKNLKLLMITPDKCTVLNY